MFTWYKRTSLFQTDQIMDVAAEERRDRRNFLRRERRANKPKEQAGEILADAELRASEIVADAELKASTLIEEAETKCEQVQSLMQGFYEVNKLLKESSLVLESSCLALKDDILTRRTTLIKLEEDLKIVLKRLASLKKVPDVDMHESDTPNRSARRQQAIVTEMVELFNIRTKTHNFLSKKRILELFWTHKSVYQFHPSTLGSSRLDRSVTTAMLDMKDRLGIVKGVQRTDFLATKQVVLTSLVGQSTVTKRYQSSLATALGIRRENIYKARKRRHVLDTNKLERMPLGKRKGRSDKLSQEIREKVTLYWETRTRVSPNKKDEARKRLSRNNYEHHRVHWLEETEVEFYLHFKEWCLLSGDTNIVGLRSFQYLKPYYVRTLKDRNVCCCKQHVEMDLLKEALNKFRLNCHPPCCTCICSLCAPMLLESHLDTRTCAASKATVKSVREWCEQIVCPREEGQQWHRKDCIMGECLLCGPTKLQTCAVEIDTVANPSIDWQSFQYVELEIPGESKKSKAEKTMKRLRMVYNRTSVADFFAKVKQTMVSFVIHNFRARWQSQEYKRCLETFPPGTIVSSIDFAENYTFKMQNEVQSMHWDNKQITLLVLCTYRHEDSSPENSNENPVDRNIIADYHFYVSDDNSHDTLFVQHCLDLHWKWMVQENIYCRQHWMWSDGCAAQFKACRPFYFVARYYSTYGAEMTWCFHASGHGKGVHDGLGGTVKTALEREQLKGIHGHKLEDAHDAVEFCKIKFRVGSEKEYGGIQGARRYFWEIGVNEVDRHKQWDCETIKGTRQLHCFRGFSKENPSLLSIRELCCFCPSCIYRDGEECPNLQYAGPWKLQNVHPRNVEDLSQFVLNMGSGEGVHEDAGLQGTYLGDCIKIGEFFAVEAMQPNQWKAAFYIMQCDEEVSLVELPFTDAYGNSFKEGDNVLSGLWYQQWGKKETCFVLPDKAPSSSIHAESIVHIRFGLQPTGLIKSSKSFTLAPDTLEAILASLKRYGAMED